MLARQAPIYIQHLATKLSVQVKGSGLPDRAVDRRYWFYGAAYDLEPQMAYLRALRRVTESELETLISGLPRENARPEPQRPAVWAPLDRPRFRILDYVEPSRRVGRVTQCPSCAAAGRDRGRDNLAIWVEEPQKYICRAGCTKQQIRAALGAPIPVACTR